MDQAPERNETNEADLNFEISDFEQNPNQWALTSLGLSEFDQWDTFGRPDLSDWIRAGKPKLNKWLKSRE